MKKLTMAKPVYSLTGKKIWVAGETGLVGRAVLRALQKHDVDVLSAPHSILDLTDQAATYDWLLRHRPDIVIMAAARVGGIGANTTYPADFIRDNLSIAHNTIEGARRAGVQKFLFLGSSCIYPRESAQPISEDALLSGPLEPTNEAYAIAKIAGLKMCQYYRTQYGLSYISAMPTNLYGPFDRFDPENSHVLPAMMMKFHDVKTQGDEELVLWGTGTPLREFLHVDDLARALLVLLEHYDDAPPVNIGSGKEITIAGLAAFMAGVTGYRGRVRFDPSRPDGMMRKMIDCARIGALGWAPQIGLNEGIRSTYDWYLANHAAKRNAA